MTKLQNLVIPLVNIDIFQMTLIFVHCCLTSVISVLQTVCRCTQCLYHLNYYWNFLKLLVNLNLHFPRLQTPQKLWNIPFPLPSSKCEDSRLWFRRVVAQYLYRIELHYIKKITAWSIMITISLNPIFLSVSFLFQLTFSKLPTIQCKLGSWLIQ